MDKKSRANDLPLDLENVLDKISGIMTDTSTIQGGLITIPTVGASAPGSEDQPNVVVHHYADGKVEVHDYPSNDAALRAALDLVGVAGSFLQPAIEFHQGNRVSYSTAMPLVVLKRVVDTSKSASKKSSMEDLQKAWQRPVLDDHVENIAQYIDYNPSSYIIPGLTLNVQEPVSVFTVAHKLPIKVAYLVIPNSAALLPTDGQHRYLALVKRYDRLTGDEKTQFGKEGVACMLTCETNLEKAHQDFADCSKTKQLPPAMLVSFDLKNPANKVTRLCIELCPVFTNKVDPTGKNISKKSSFLFNANQVRQLVKATLTGDIALADESFNEKARDEFQTEVATQAYSQKLAEYVNFITERLPVWREVSRIPKEMQYAKLKGIRERGGYLCLTATGLNIMGLVCHNLMLRFGEVWEQGGWKPYAEALAKLDWSKSNHELWSDVLSEAKDKLGNLKTESVTENGQLVKRTVWKIATQRHPVESAFAKVIKAIDLPIS
jgi:DNA sulfur modification protein DndB